jgi:hypothetical protein
MDPFVTVVVVVAIGAAVGWWLLRRNRQAPVEDEWVLPPETGTRRLPPEPTAQVFDRESLLRRDRSLDVSGWDDSPDLDGEAAEGQPKDAPPVLDRDFLRRRADGDASAGEDGAPR